MQFLKILNFVTQLPIHFQLNLNTCTERVNSLSVSDNVILQKEPCKSDLIKWVEFQRRLFA